MMRRLIRASACRAVLPALLGLAGCAGTQATRDRITHGNSVDLPAVSQSHADRRPLTSAESGTDSSFRPARVVHEPVGREAVDQASSVTDDAASDVTAAVSTSADDDVAPTAITEKPDLDASSRSGDIPEVSPEVASAGYMLSLGGILQLADARNPNVAVARERIDEAYARVERADALWLPSLRAGVSYNHHEGAIQSVEGEVFRTNRSLFGGGLGANMVGAASPAVPGLIAQFHLSDAIFQPKIASHQAASRRFGAVAARNDVLRDAAVAYLELIRSEHGMAIAREALENTEQLAELTRHYSETGQGLQSDHQRMEAELAIRRNEMAIQQESIDVASARLAQILHADPSVLIMSGEPAVTPLDIMAVDSSAASYVALGLSRRPELCEQQHLVCEAVERLNREKFAPLIPSVLLGMSYGGMGGGLGNSIVNTSERWDADAVAYWEIRNLGFGERAARGETASAARQAQLREVALLDLVAREVVQAHSQVIQRNRRLQLTQQGIVAADQSYELNHQRIVNGQGLPIEVLQSVQALANARRAYLNAVVDYNIAQFELSRATGWFAEE